MESSRARIEPSVPPLCKADSSPLDYHRSPDLNAFGKPVFLLAVVLFTFQPFGEFYLNFFFVLFPCVGVLEIIIHAISPLRNLSFPL